MRDSQASSRGSERGTLFTSILLNNAQCLVSFDANRETLAPEHCQQRALLPDWPLVSLHRESAATSPPSDQDNSYSVYFHLGQDAEDWAWLQAEKSPALVSLEVKVASEASFCGWNKELYRNFRVAFMLYYCFLAVALHVAMLHDLCHCAHNQLSGSSSSRDEDRMNEMSCDLTESQQDTLSKFREILSEQGLLRKRDDDHTLLRFLRARGYEIAKAKVMYEAMLDWRKEIGADTIRETFEFPERKAIRDLYPHFHHKTDKLGRPVYIERLGQLNVDELLKITTMDRMLLYHVKEWEVLIDSKFPACSKKAGTCISQSLTILDLKGVTMKHMSKQVRHFIQKITKVDQDYYPEFLGKMFIVNAPTAFKAIWAMIKPWLDKRTQKKIELHGGHFSSKLLELVDSENLPEFLGGTCNCLGGCENSDAGPWNEALYSSDALYDEPIKAAA